MPTDSKGFPFGVTRNKKGTSSFSLPEGKDFSRQCHVSRFVRQPKCNNGGPGRRGKEERRATSLTRGATQKPRCPWAARVCQPAGPEQGALVPRVNDRQLDGKAGAASVSAGTSRRDSVVLHGISSEVSGRNTWHCAPGPGTSCELPVGERTERGGRNEPRL